MANFTAERCYRQTDEDGNVIVSFVVKGYERRLAEMSCDAGKKMSSIIVSISEPKSKRSLEQNSMLWSLLTKLAEKTAGTKNPDTINALYCTVLEQANIESSYIIAPPETEQKLKRTFRAIREIGKREINGKPGILYQVFVGSSKFTIKEMSEFIEIVLSRCAEFGIYDQETERIMQENRK